MSPPTLPAASPTSAPRKVPPVCPRGMNWPAASSSSSIPRCVSAACTASSIFSSDIRKQYDPRTSLIPGAETRDPAGDVLAVPLVFGAEAPPEGRLLGEREVDRVQREEDRCRDCDRCGAKRERLSDQDGQHGGDHRVANVAVRPLDDEVSGRVPGRERAAADLHEQGDGPGEECEARGEDERANRAPPAEVHAVAPDEAAGNDERHGARQHHDGTDVPRDRASPRWHVALIQAALLTEVAALSRYATMPRPCGNRVGTTAISRSATTRRSGTDGRSRSSGWTARSTGSACPMSTRRAS